MLFRFAWAEQAVDRAHSMHPQAAGTLLIAWLEYLLVFKSNQAPPSPCSGHSVRDRVVDFLHELTCHSSIIWPLVFSSIGPGLSYFWLPLATV